MEHDRNQSHPGDLTRAQEARERSPQAPIPGTPEPDEVMRWVTAAFVAAAALLGLVVLVAIIAFALQPPGWVQMLLGIAMAGGAVFFAWLVASALRKDDSGTDRR